MARITNRFTVKGLASKPPGKHHDGNGLYLQVTNTGSRSWLYRYMLNGKPHWMGLGPISEISLAEARERVLDLRKQKRSGVNPLVERRAAHLISEQSATAVEKHPFRTCAEEYIESRAASWSSPKHAAQWSSTLATYAYPLIGSRCVSDINTELVLEIIKPIWFTKTETANRVRGRIEQVLDFAAAKQWRDRENPARWKGHLDKLLPAPKTVTPVEHHPALPWRQMAAFMQALRKHSEISARALEFVILTAARTSEVRHARWSEIDFERKIWTAPAAHMKGRKGEKRAHRKALSDDAIALLRALPRIADEELIFPGEKPNRPLSENTMNDFLKAMAWGKAVVHGFRASFRDWAGDATEYPKELAEMAMAHVISNKVEAAYRRGDMLDRRRPLMNDWADFCRAASTAVQDQPAATGIVSGTPDFSAAA